MNDARIKVFVVDDSQVARDLLVHILGSDSEIEVIGIARDGEEALRTLEEKRPDVITMDIHMPKLNGYETTRRIMETHPAPIVIVSASRSTHSDENAFRIMEAGAVAVVEKPRGYGDPDHAEMAATLVRTVKLMSEVRVVKRWTRARLAVQPAMRPPCPPPPEGPVETKGVDIVAIGASTGGPPVLHKILSGLNGAFPAPILIVQHITAGFAQGFGEWLGQVTGLPVKLAQSGERPRAGHVYIAPDGCHLVVERGGLLGLINDPPENGLRPAVSQLFRSVAHAYGERALGILLTGMGRDGAAELGLMRQRGAVTIAQDQESSVVFGMPGEAVKLGAATHVLPPERIAATLEALMKK